MTRKAILGVVAVIVAGAIVGGEPAAPDWQGEGRLYWGRPAGREDTGYVAVRMHAPRPGRVPQWRQVANQEPGPESGAWLESTRNDPNTPVAAPQVDHRLSRPPSEVEEDNWLAEEMDPSLGRPPSSGWGWLADDVLKRRTEARAAREAAEPVTDDSGSSPALDTGQMHEPDPYAELYDMWEK